MEPFVSIGVTTYRRRALLKECLTSILQQTYPRFEIIVGNDEPAEELCASQLGMADPRLRFINNPENLGQIRNMNMLLNSAKGTHFTWLADDDLYTPRFLEVIVNAINVPTPVECIFTSYHLTEGEPVSQEVHQHPTVVLTGQHFTERFLREELSVLGCYGVFRVETLVELGGMTELGPGSSLYADMLLALKAGTLPLVAYNPAPLLQFRAHANSLSWTSTDASLYFSAQRDLIRLSTNLLESRRTGSTTVNMYHLLRRCSRDFWVVMRRSRTFRIAQALRYLLFLGSNWRHSGLRILPVLVRATSDAARVGVRLTASKIKQSLLHVLRKKSNHRLET